MFLLTKAGRVHHTLSPVHHRPQPLQSPEWRVTRFRG